jgi:hypothetical protein
MPRQHTTIFAAVVLLLTWQGSGKDVQFPKALEKSLVLRLEADQEVVTDAETSLMSSSDEPAVLSWGDLSSHGRKAVVNETHDSNKQQREKNRVEDGTRPTEETNNLPRAKRRSDAQQHDSAPALVTCPTLKVPAIFFDGDDYMFVDSEKGDDFTPSKGGITVVAMMNAYTPEGNQSSFFNSWMGLGHPGIMADSQYTMHTSKEEPEEVFGKDGKPKPPKPLEGPPKGNFHLRAVPVSHDPMTPSVRDHAEIQGQFLLDKPTIVSFSLTGKKVLGRANGDDTSFKAGASGFTEGKWTYRGKVDPHEDVPGTDFYIGAGPSAKWMIDFTGEGAYGLLYGLLVFNRQLAAKGLDMAENYLACRFDLEEQCDKASKKAEVKDETPKETPKEAPKKHAVNYPPPKKKSKGKEEEL